MCLARACACPPWLIRSQLMQRQSSMLHAMCPATSALAVAVVVVAHRHDHRQKGRSGHRRRLLGQGHLQSRYPPVAEVRVTEVVVALLEVGLASYRERLE